MYQLPGKLSKAIIETYDEYIFEESGNVSSMIEDPMLSNEGWREGISIEIEGNSAEVNAHDFHRGFGMVKNGPAWQIVADSIVLLYGDNDMRLAVMAKWLRSMAV